MKGYIEALLTVSHAGAAEYALCTTENAFHPGRCATVSVNGKQIGIFGEVHPEVAANYGIGAPTYVAQLDFDAMFENSKLNADVVTYSMYLLGIVVALISLLIMRNTTMRGEASPFIMELPLYHLPGVKSLALHLWDKAKHFIQKAFTIILISCVIIWFLSNFGWDWKYLGEAGMDKSILASVGKLVQSNYNNVSSRDSAGHHHWNLRNKRRQP